MTPAHLASALALSLLLPACNGGGEPDPRPNWYEDIQPLVAENCRGCHMDGGIANFPMDDYQSTSLFAGLMAENTASRAMPPYPADETDECVMPQGFQHDMRLNQDQIDMFGDWAQLGAPEGAPENAAPYDEFTASELEGVTHTFSLADSDSSWSVSADQTVDDYRCFAFDPELTIDEWMTGITVVPGDNAGLDSIVHHVVLFLDVDGQSGSAAWNPPTLDADGSWKCEGGPGVDNFSVLGVWAPGTQHFETPEDVAMKVPAGSRIIMQMHYHPQGQDNTDSSTTIKLRMQEESPPNKLHMKVYGAAFGEAPGDCAPASCNRLQEGPNDDGQIQFFIPNDAIEHTETFHIPLTVGGGNDEGAVWAVFPHMHIAGVDLLATIEHSDPPAGTPTEECLLQTPRWDFGYQYIYSYATSPLDSPRMYTGDILKLRCTYTNNTDENELLANYIEDDPLIDATDDIVLGEGTLDEMCILFLGVITPN